MLPSGRPLITITLLHPLQSVAVQDWTFGPQSVIRIGRSTDNEVILYSAVVSRHHVELRCHNGTDWEIINLGANGTYIDGRRINQTPVEDGMVIRLASSGPKIKITFGSRLEVEKQKQQSPKPAVTGQEINKDTYIDKPSDEDS